ncbi:hypothetical protein P4T04_05025 [Bacillus badius]|uniref:hypothetical protein n=1 Tax=Bacillus badius TaxID=1455 RepID=UPI002E2401ED|nr:hypothetical protein [Bacillus badius]
MDHAIESLKQFLYAELDSYHEGYSTREEIKTYVKAINELEKYYYGEVKTLLEVVLA